VLKGPKDLQVTLEYKELKELKVQQELKELKVQQEQQVHQDLRIVD
jgi:hypothetical protein